RLQYCGSTRGRPRELVGSFLFYFQKEAPVVDLVNRVLEFWLPPPGRMLVEAVAPLPCGSHFLANERARGHTLALELHRASPGLEPGADHAGSVLRSRQFLEERAKRPWPWIARTIGVEH